VQDDIIPRFANQVIIGSRPFRRRRNRKSSRDDDILKLGEEAGLGNFHEAVQNSYKSNEVSNKEPRVAFASPLKERKLAAYSTYESASLSSSSLVQVVDYLLH
jgi:hypothetical protein